MPKSPVVPALLSMLLLLAACSGGGGDSTTTAATETGAAQTQDGTSRAALLDLVPRYLDALVAHDSTQVPMAANAVLVENAKRIAPGEGLWQSASAAGGDFRILVPDPVSGQVGAIVIMEENGEPIELGLRLQVQDGQIIAAEHLVARDLRENALPNLQEPREAFSATIPTGQRLDRDELLRIGYSYYDALDQNNGSLAPFADDCVRRENGLQTSTNPPVEGATGIALFGQLRCAPQLDTGAMAYIDVINNRRVTIADPETGLVFGLSHFRHSMEQKVYPITGVPGVTEHTVDFEPFDLPAAHVFKVGADRQIHEIEALGFMLPYDSPTGWGW